MHSIGRITDVKDVMKYTYASISKKFKLPNTYNNHLKTPEKSLEIIHDNL